MPTSLDSRTRSERLREATGRTCDLLVIGGGATGAGIALDAASRGLNTLLLEKRDFAWGTSSRSTKLIHGGLRYLKQLDIGLVREVGRERAIVHANAPHLVHPEEMLLPIIENGSLGRYSTPVGLWVYEKLASVPKEERFRSLSREETLRAEPLLDPKSVRGGAVYREYRTDDARLVMALVRTAAREGAELFNYAEVTGFLYVGGRVHGVQVTDVTNGRSMSFRARCVVNASGPWCDEVRRLDAEPRGTRLLLSKGVHLVFRRDRFPLRRAVYFDVPGDRRMIFAIPRGRTTYLGTTDTVYEGDTDRPRVEREDASYLLEAANEVFPKIELKEEDVESGWAGLRALVDEEGKSPGELSRKDEIFHAESGLLSIAGGKLTGYRRMAQRVVDRAMTSMAGEGGIGFNESKTESITLVGGDFGHYAEIATFKQRLLGENGHPHASPDWIDYAVDTYGTEARTIRRMAGSHDGDLLAAEIAYAVETEAVVTLNDFLIRRTGRLFFDRPDCGTIYRTVADRLAGILGWDPAEKDEQIDRFENEWRETVAWRKT